MPAREPGRLKAYATALSGCALAFMTLGSAVTFFDVAAARYLHLPEWVMVAALAGTLGLVGWHIAWLFGRARAFELNPEADSSDVPGSDPPPGPPRPDERGGPEMSLPD